MTIRMKLKQLLALEQERLIRFCGNAGVPFTDASLDFQTFTVEMNEAVPRLLWMDSEIYTDIKLLYEDVLSWDSVFDKLYQEKVVSSALTGKIDKAIQSRMDKLKREYVDS
jgi:hypothetical protein